MEPWHQFNKIYDYFTSILLKGPFNGAYMILWYRILWNRAQSLINRIQASCGLLTAFSQYYWINSAKEYIETFVSVQWIIANHIHWCRSWSLKESKCTEYRVATLVRIPLARQKMPRRLNRCKQISASRYQRLQNIHDTRIKNHILFKFDQNLAHK